MVLNRHVVKTNVHGWFVDLKSVNDYIGQDVYYHTVTGDVLPLDASEQELKAKLFLKGQEEDAIRYHLSKRIKALYVCMIPTWNCNLRCSHCSVSHLLTDTPEQKLNTNAIFDFMLRYEKLRGEIQQLHLAFVGGEPLLEVEACSDIINKIENLKNRSLQYKALITTNLAMRLEQKHIDFLSKMSVVTVSVDGLEKDHNTQRKPHNDSFNPFVQTIQNLKKLIIAGLDLDKIHVQAAVSDDFMHDSIRKKEFMKFIMKFGLKPKNILISGIRPTVDNPKPGRVYLDSIAKSIDPGQCCRYRYHKYVTDNSGSVYSDFYTWEKLGEITDPIEKLEAKRTEIIQNMPVLYDKKCMKCPAIGCCWGRCASIHIMPKPPSHYCNQKLMIKKLNKAASEGGLI